MAAVEDASADNISLKLDHLNITSSSLESLGFSLCSDMRGAKGRVIFSLDDLEVGKLWWSEQGNTILRLNGGEILLGGSVLSLFLPLVSSTKAAATAEKVLEQLNGSQISLGLPITLSIIEKDGQRSQHGRVIFSLRELPLMQDVTCSVRKGQVHKICVLPNDIALINCIEYPLEACEAAPPLVTPISPREPVPIAAATPEHPAASHAPASPAKTPELGIEDPPLSPYENKEEYRAHLQESMEKKRAALREQKKKQMMDELHSKYCPD